MAQGLITSQIYSGRVLSKVVPPLVHSLIDQTNTMTTANFVKEADDSFRYLSTEDVLWPVATDELKETFKTNGFVIIRDLFSAGEVEKLVKAIEGCEEFWSANYPLLDLNHRQFFQSNWNDPGTDILGMTVRNAKFVGIAEQLLNRGELYLYNGKVIMKQPKTGGALLWHQDYGYWYNNRAIFPDFITGVIALTKSDRENGGLEVIRGSHHCGRIEHNKQAGQTGADRERVELILKTLEHVYVDLAAGDAVLFHANMLHKSEPNVSEHRRWNLIFSFNTKQNSPDRKHYNAQYSPLDKVPADAVIKCESLQVHHREYLDPTTNPNVTVVTQNH